MTPQLNIVLNFSPNNEFSQLAFSTTYDVFQPQAVLPEVVLWLFVFCWLVARLCQTLCDPWAAARQASLSLTISRSLLRLMSIELVMPSSQSHPVICM